MADLRVVRLGRQEGAAAASLARAGLPLAPVLVLVGGAGGLPEDEEEALVELFRRHVIPAVVDAGATVVDGGTDAGIMRAMGLARALSDARFPLVGVAAEGTVNLPDDDDPDEAGPRAGADAHHSHLVLVPGREWGDESPWLSAVADALSSSGRSATLLVNGGDIAYDDVRHSLAAGRPVVVLAGSGRTADAIAHALSDPLAGGPVRELAGSPLVRLVPMANPHLLSTTLAALLSPRT